MKTVQVNLTGGRLHPVVPGFRQGPNGTDMGSHMGSHMDARKGPHDLAEQPGVSQLYGFVKRTSATGHTTGVSDIVSRSRDAQFTHGIALHQRYGELNASQLHCIDAGAEVQANQGNMAAAALQVASQMANFGARSERPT